MALMAGAITAEILGTVFLRLSDGLGDPLYVFAVITAYGLSIALFGEVLRRGVTLGVAYGVITSSGLLASSALSALAFGEPLALGQVCGLIVIGAGAWLLQGGRSR